MDEKNKKTLQTVREEIADQDFQKLRVVLKDLFYNTREVSWPKEVDVILDELHLYVFRTPSGGRGGMTVLEASQMFVRQFLSIVNDIPVRGEQLKMALRELAFRSHFKGKMLFGGKDELITKRVVPRS